MIKNKYTAKSINIKKHYITAFLVGLLIQLYVSNNIIETIDYEIKSDKIPDSFRGFKILQLSDLHDKQFGKYNSHLIKKID